MKTILCIVLVCVLAATITIADDDTESNKTVQTKVNIDTTTICSSCNCFSSLKLLKCVKRNLYDMFTADDWITLNKTDMSFENVDMSHNTIKTITVFPNVNILTLNFSHNEIESIEMAAFKGLPNLEYLDLSANKLSSAALKPEVFAGKYDATTFEPLKKLRVLKLRDNNLHTLDNDIFEHFPSLEELDVSENPFKVIDQSSIIAISGIASLRVLDMEEMELSEIPIHLFHSPRALEKLDLSGNLLKRIPEALEYAIGLQELRMDANPIIDIQGDHVFPTLTNLTKLSISFISTLTTIGKGGLSGLVGLEDLEISNNMRLSYIDGSALSKEGTEEKEREEWPPIKRLRLQNNNLSRLEKHLIGNWGKIEDADFVRNPWVCDCDNQWLVTVLMPVVIAENNSQLIEGVICDSPIEMKGVHVHELAEKGSHMRCLDKYNARPERDSVVLVGILVGLLIGIPLTLGLIWIYKNGFFGLFGGVRGPADYSRAFYKRAGNQDDFYI